MSKKKLLSFILCFVFLLSCIVFTDNLPTAKGGTTGVYESKEPVTPSESDFTYRAMPVNNPEKAIITGYSGSETKIIVPETLNGLPVTNITYSAFSKNENITYIKLPSTLVGIAGNAFNLCSSLTEIDVDSSNEIFTSIDGVLYRKDTANGKINTLVIFPAGKGGKFTIPYGIETIGSYAFEHCYNLTQVDMYNTVTDINSYAFSYCWNLESIRLSDNLSTLGAQALAHCDSLTRLDLPAKLNNIGADAVLGDIDSDDNKFYYFIDGISCAKDSYAYDYLIKQHLPESIIIQNNPSITDNDTGIKLIDAYGVFPKGDMIDISVEPVEINEVEGLIPTKYSKAFIFDISIKNENKPYTPEGNVIFNFDAVCPDAIPSATKVYQQIGNELVLVSGSAHTPFVGAQVSEGGRFIILVNDDFSLKGDIDGDGVVSLFDVKAALHASAGTLMLTPEQTATANLDKSADGKITTEDARKILRLAGGMDSE